MAGCLHNSKLTSYIPASNLEIVECWALHSRLDNLGKSKFSHEVIATFDLSFPYYVLEHILSALVENIRLFNALEVQWIPKDII